VVSLRIKVEKLQNVLIPKWMDSFVKYIKMSMIWEYWRQRADVRVLASEG